MKKLYKYYLEHNTIVYTKMGGIYQEDLKNKDLIINTFSYQDKVSYMNIVKKSMKDIIYLDLDPKLFHDNPELFMVIFNEKLKNL